MLAVSVAIHIDLLHVNLSCARRALQLAVLRNDGYVFLCREKT